MTVFEQQLIAALALLVAALFVSAGLPIAPSWRKRLRIAAIGVFLLSIVVSLGEIARWAIEGLR